METALWPLVVAGCSPQADLGGGPPQPIGGELQGLNPGQTITLQNNVGDELTLSSNGSFTFPTPLAIGETYSVTIRSSPSSPLAQTCGVSNASGMVTGLPVANVTVDCDLFAYYPFQGNAKDASGYGHDAVVVDATLASDRNGNANSAYSFAGTGSIQAVMPAGFLPSGTEARTLTVWFEPKQHTNILGLVYWGVGNCTAKMFGLGDLSDKAAFWSGCNDYFSGLVLPVGSWSFVAIVYTPDIPTQITFYVGDQSETAPIAALATPSVGNLVIGADLATGTAFNGKIGAVRVYGRALNSAEVHAIFTSTEP